MKITSLEALRREIEKGIEDSLPEMAKELEKTVKEEVDTSVYGVYSPVEGGYERNYSLRDSIEGRAVNKNTLEIKHDTSKINAFSIKTGESVADGLPEIVHDGWAPNIFNDKTYIWMSSRPYMDKAVSNIESSDEHVKLLKAGLRARGFTVK